MSRFDLCAFDLDGTLIDTRDDLAASINVVRARFGLPPVPVPQVVRWVGDGAPVLVARALGNPEASPLDNEQTTAGLALFREHYTEHMLDQARPYAGVPETLAELRERELTLVVASNKPVAMCRDMLDRLGLGEHFADVSGGDSLPVSKPDPAPILALLEAHGAPAERAVMIGDGTQDLEAGRAAKVTTVAALWGFRDRAELEPFAPDHWVERFADLLELV